MSAITGISLSAHAAAGELGPAGAAAEPKSSATSPLLPCVRLLVCHGCLRRSVRKLTRLISCLPSEPMRDELGRVAAWRRLVSGKVIVVMLGDA